MSLKDFKKRLVFIVLLSLSIVWSALIIFEVYIANKKIKENIIQIAVESANTAFLKDTLYRKWVARNGGVYVPVSDFTPPNPYLSHIESRDVYTRDGKRLTLVNPAYFTRQVYEMSGGTVIQGHLTSDILLNPINKPDEWQKEALKAVLKGNEYTEMTEIGGEPYLRFMRPFVTEESCLKCHSFQGYQTGDVRGGISVDVPLNPYISKIAKLNKTEWVTHTIIWLFGMSIIAGLAYLLKIIFKKDDATAVQLRQEVDKEVSLRRKREEVIFEQKKLADLGMMINAIAHQWRQPLNVIGLLSQNVADAFRAGELSIADVDRFEKTQMETLLNLSGVIDDFRSSFKPDKTEEPFEIIKEVVKLLQLIEPQLNSKGIKLLVSCSCKLESTKKFHVDSFPKYHYPETRVKGYKNEFKQVIANIIYNAIDSIEARIGSNAEFDRYIHVAIKRENDSIVITIEDNGIGIPEKVQPYIFNPYFTTKDEGKGTGLGLYIAKMVIEKHMHGDITLLNSVNPTSFEIILPTEKI